MRLLIIPSPTEMFHFVSFPEEEQEQYSSLLQEKEEIRRLLMQREAEVKHPSNL